MNFRFLIDNCKILFILLLLLSSCIEDQSLILNPNNGESYQYKTFKLNNLNSYSFNENEFSQGNSSRLYLGNLNVSDDSNENIELYSYIKIDKELLNNNAFCNAENINNFNNIDLILPVTSFQKLDELDNYVYPDINSINPSTTNEYNDDRFNHYIKAYIISEDDMHFLDYDMESQNFVSFIDPSILQGSDYAHVIIDKLTNNLRVQLDDYIYSNFSNDLKDDSEDCTLFDYENCKLNTNCYWDISSIDFDQNNDGQLDDDASSILSSFTSGYHCYNESTFSNVVCNELEDLNIILEYNNPNSENDQIIELYSSDNETITFSPYLDIDYDENGISTESINKCTFDTILSNELSSNEFLYNLNESSDGYGMILGFDQTLTTLYNNLSDISCTCPNDCGDDGLCPGDDDYPQNCDNNNNFEDCNINNCYWINNNCQAADYHENDGICNDNSYLESSCTFNGEPFQIESNPIIPADWNGELFQIDINLNQDNVDLIDEISFYFSDIYFIYKDLDPNNDNYTIDSEDDNKTEGNGIWDFNDCGSDNDCEIIDSDSTQENNIVDIGESHELFDDYGIDNCPNIYETGINAALSQCGDENNNLYNNNGFENNLEWDDSGNGVGLDGICQIDECELFDDYGYDKASDEYESGCFDTDNLFGGKLDGYTYSQLINECSLDILELDVEICNEQYICGQLHWNLEDCIVCSQSDPNGDNYNDDPSNDNWIDCNENQSICADQDGWDSETMGDGIWNEGENFEGNDQWDWEDTNDNGKLDLCTNYFDLQEDCDRYEYFNDIGIDGIPDAYENYSNNSFNDNYDLNTNPNGSEGNNFRDENEPFFDYGLDQIQTIDEFNFNQGQENNKKYDKDGDFEESFQDYGLDQCQNSNEIGDSNCCEEGVDCDSLNVSDLEDPNNDNYNIDPNNDETENNNILDWNDCNDDLTICDGDVNWDPSIGNGIWDEGEGERWYDYGYDQKQDIEEDNYYANIANYIVSSGNNYQISLDEQSIFFDEPTLANNKQVGLWVSSIEQIDNNYRLTISLHTLIDLVAFQFKINHWKYQYEIESINNKSLYLFGDYYINNGVYNNYEINSSESGDKYILDTTIYDSTLGICQDENLNYFCSDYNHNSVYNLNDLSLCQEECLGLCVKGCSDELNVMNGFGIKSSFDFISSDDDELNLDDFIDNNSNANISFEYTNLIVYFDRTEDNLLFNHEESIQINIEYFDQESNEFLVYSNIGSKTIAADQDSLKINISPLIQDYINNNIDYNNIIISSKNNSYNFSNLPIIYNDLDSNNNPRLEIFYSE